MTESLWSASQFATLSSELTGVGSASTSRSSSWQPVADQAVLGRTSPLPAIQEVRAARPDFSPSSSRRDVSNAVQYGEAVTADRSDSSSGSERQPPADAHLRTSPFLQDLLDRLVRIELGQKSIMTGFQSVRADVDMLMRERGAASSIGSPSVISHNPNARTPPQPDPATQDQLAQLSNQIASLGSSVAQLLTNTAAQQSPMPSPAVMPPASVPRRSPLPTPSLRQMSFDAPSATTGTAMWETANAQPSPAARWEALGIAAELAHQAVAFGLTSPSKIQAKALPCLLKDQDIVAQATSTQERITSYVLPALHLLRQAPSSNALQCLIITCTMDQASQAHRLATALGSSFGIRSSVLGATGHPSDDIGSELRSLQARTPSILIGTPQRLLDLFAMRSLPVESLRLLVIDEIDDILSRNLGDFVVSLIRLLPSARATNFDPFGSPASRRTMRNTIERQTAVFASTIPQEVLDFATTLHLREPVRVLTRRESVAATAKGIPGDEALAAVRNVRHHYLFVAIANTVNRGSLMWKQEAVCDLLEDAEFRQAVVFCSTLENVEAVAFKLASRNIEALSLTEEMGTSARDTVLRRFRSPTSASGTVKKALVLIDTLGPITELPQIPLCVLFDLPTSAEQYAHRVASTASTSYQRPGMVVSVATTDADIEMLRRIETLFRIRVQPLPSLIS